MESIPDDGTKHSTNEEFCVSVMQKKCQASYQLTSIVSIRSMSSIDSSVSLSQLQAVVQVSLLLLVNGLGRQRVPKCEASSLTVPLFFVAVLKLFLLSILADPQPKDA